MTNEYIEKESGRKLTPEQKKDLSRAAWFQANADIIDYLQTHKNEVKKIKQHIKEESKD